MLNLLFSFEGRISRRTFWVLMFVVFVGSIVTSAIDFETMGKEVGKEETYQEIPSFSIVIMLPASRDITGCSVCLVL